MARQRNLSLGVFFTLLSFFGLTLTNVLVKLVGSNISTYQILFMQYIVCFIMISVYTGFKERHVAFLKSSHFLLLFLRALAGFVTFILIYVSLTHVSVANATLLFNTAPFFTPLLLYLFFKDPMDHRLWLGIFIGFLGIIFILNPRADIFKWHALLPLLSGVTGACIFLTLGRLHHYHEPMLRILFYLFLFGLILSLPLGILYWKTLNLKDWFYLIAIALAVFFSQVAVTIGFRFASAKVLAPLCYSSVVFAVIFDWLIWKETPTLPSILGMILVITGGIITLWIENSQKNRHIT